jgi:hypothetical protein
MSLCFINSWAARLRVCREIASALAACHAAGVLHRDLTSFNVMLSDMHDISAGAQDDALCWLETVRSHANLPCMTWHQDDALCWLGTFSFLCAMPAKFKAFCYGAKAVTL